MSISHVYAREIRTLPLFSSLSEESFAKISLFGNLIYRERGENLFLQDDRADHFYLLRSGAAKQFLMSSNGSCKTVEIVRAGSLFCVAEMFTEKHGYMMNCQLLENSNLFAFSNRSYLDVLKENPECCSSVMANLGSRIYQYQQNICSLRLYSASDRFSNYLLSLIPKDHYGESEIYLPIKKSEIADLLSIKRETLSRILQKLSSENVIEVVGDNIRILDTRKFREDNGNHHTADVLSYG